MYPEVFPGRWDPAAPEFEVYQVLKTLPENYHVFYSKRLTGGGLFGKPECEIDFIVFNGSNVVICLEVKGGVVAYDGTQNQWMQNGKVMRDVIRQATEASHTLLNALTRELHDTRVDWALCFPNCCLTSHNGAFEIQPEQIIDENGILNINASIKRLENHIRGKFGRCRPLSASEAKALVGRLTRNIGFVQILGVRFAREADQIVQVTNEQLEVLTDIEANQRMLVHGVAGTGKTIIAQTFAKQLAERNLKVLLLFFNQEIASNVRYAFERGSTVQVTTFSSFAKRLIEDKEPAWWQSQTEKDNEFWSTTLPLKLLDIPKHSLPCFDAVIVDEGQDFKPEWFEFLNQLLSHGSDVHYTVFLDEHQDIFGHWKHFPCQPPPAKKVLVKNCRNTRRIVDFLNGVYPTGMTSFEKSPPGASVVERRVKNESEELEQLERDIKTLTGEQRITPGSIVILINSSKSDSCLRNVRSINNLELVSTYKRYDAAARVLYYSTIDIFKGLEADVVFLIVGDRISALEMPKALYVQGSRAKHLLYVYRRT